MIRLYDNLELAPTITTIPPEGKYISVVTDVYTVEIEPVSEGKKLVHVVCYSLVGLRDFKTYEFFETVSPYKGLPRTEAFVETLESYGLEYFPDDELLGLVEEIKISYDFIAGYSIPVITSRKRLSVKEDKDGLRDEDLPF